MRVVDPKSKYHGNLIENNYVKSVILSKYNTFLYEKFNFTYINNFVNMILSSNNIILSGNINN